MQTQMNLLKEKLAEVEDLYHVLQLAGWDQETFMPSGAAEARAEHMATLSKIAHEKFTADEVGRLLESLSSQADTLDYDSDDAALLRVTDHDYQKARKLPTQLVADLSRATALGVEAWKKARADNDFGYFQPHLQKIVDLNIQKAEAWGYEEHIYDALLDDYEPEMKSSQVATIFKQVRQATVPLVQAITEHSSAVDDSVMHQYFDPQKQWDFGMTVIRDFGFDFNRGRQDKSTHPFTTSFDTHDVRLTTRIMDNYFPSALSSTMHEAGHGMYEQGFADSLRRTPLGDATSLGVHESQSRMWENIVGRSREFWSHYFSQAQRLFPQQLGHVNLETFYRGMNKVTPSLIRVEADEVTYNLHIFIRFEIERELLSGTIKVADLPQLWNEKMDSYLGIVPPTDSDGVLQDTHWASGLLGYFPTYSLGNILSMQFFNKMAQEIPARDLIAAGDFAPILGWLRENIHTHGRKYTPTELISRVTGGAMDAQPYIDYITQKYTGIYGL